MSLAILLDGVQGDPSVFYEFVIREVQERQVPEVMFSMGSEFGTKIAKKWTAGEIAKEAAKAYVTAGISLLFTDKREKWPSLVVEDSLSRAVVCAYQYGSAFHVTCKSFWRDKRNAEHEREGKLSYGDEVVSGCFDESMDRAVQQALHNYLSSIQIERVPEDLERRKAKYHRSSFATEQ